MAESKSKKSADKFFDVARPGKSAPSATSRPVIITNRPVLKDPMMIRVDSGEDADAPDAAASNEMTHKVDIKPLHVDLSQVMAPGAPEVAKDSTAPADDAPAEAPAVAEPEASSPEADKPADEAAPTEEAPAPEPTVEKAEPTPETPPEAAPVKHGEKVIAVPESFMAEKQNQAATPETSPAAVTPEEPEAEPEPVAGSEEEASLDNNDRPVLSEKESKAALEAQKQAEAQEKIIASGTYFLPVNRAEKRRTKRHVLLGTLVLLILLAIAALAAWDAGVFSIPGYQAPTNFL